jgi:hypothetical protein
VQSMIEQRLHHVRGTRRVHRVPTLLRIRHLRGHRGRSGHRKERMVRYYETRRIAGPTILNRQRPVLASDIDRWIERFHQHGHARHTHLPQARDDPRDLQPSWQLRVHAMLCLRVARPSFWHNYVRITRVLARPNAHKHAHKEDIQQLDALRHGDLKSLV